MMFLIIRLFFYFYLLQNLKNLDDDALKSLLDEAISYKGPKDKENKSEIFKVRPMIVIHNNVQ